MGRDGRDGFPYFSPSFHFFDSSLQFSPPFISFSHFVFFFSSFHIFFSFSFSSSSFLLFAYCNFFKEEEYKFSRLYTKRGYGGGLDV